MLFSLKRLNQFQYHTGSIKSILTRRLFRFVYLSFNTTLVRLKDAT